MTNVTFKLGEELTQGYKIVATNGLTQYTASEGFINICFISDSGEGINYSKVKWVHDSRINRRYEAQRYLLKYVALVQSFSNQLYMKYQYENAYETMENN